MIKKPIAELTRHFHGPGKVEWIGVRPARREPMISVTEAMLQPGKGIIGDRFTGGMSSKRQVSLIQAEHLQAMATMLGWQYMDPQLLRRNLVVSGVNLLSLKGMRFSLGEALLEMSGLCHPCSRMEETFGPGGYNLVRGHGGIIAKVLTPGKIQVGSVLSDITAVSSC